MRPVRRYTSISAQFRACVYVAELRNGVIKVGYTFNPRTRMGTLNTTVKRQFKTAIVRWYISEAIQSERAARQVEKNLIGRLNVLGRPVRGHVEFFEGVRFGVVTTLIRQLSAPVCATKAA